MDPDRIPTWTPTAIPCNTSANLGDASARSRPSASRMTEAQKYVLAQASNVQQIWIQLAAPATLKVGLYDNYQTGSWPRTLLYVSPQQVMTTGLNSVVVQTLPSRQEHLLAGLREISARAPHPAGLIGLWRLARGGLAGFPLPLVELRLHELFPTHLSGLSRRSLPAPICTPTAICTPPPLERPALSGDLRRDLFLMKNGAASGKHERFNKREDNRNAWLKYQAFLFLPE